MLVYCNNLLSKSTILHDTVSDKKYLIIHKNGSSSLEQLAADLPHRYKIVSSDFLKNATCEELIVFVRNPMERFFSGLKTQVTLYQWSAKSIADTFNNDKIISFFDAHTTPQFWVLLSIGKRYNVKFKLLPMSELNAVDNNIRHMNQGSSSVELNLTEEALDRVMHFYTEDVIMYNNFLNKTVSIDEIIERIKLEKTFVDDLKQYESILTYLF